MQQHGCFGHIAHNSGARLENRVDLRTVLENFPGADEPCGHDESITGPKRAAFAGLAFYDNPSRRDHTQLVLGVANALRTTRSGPTAGKNYAPFAHKKV